MGIIEICKYMGGWTYDDYLDQPTWLIKSIIIKMRLDSKNQQRLIKNK